MHWNFLAVSMAVCSWDPRAENSEMCLHEACFQRFQLDFHMANRRKLGLWSLKWTFFRTFRNPTETGMLWKSIKYKYCVNQDLKSSAVYFIRNFRRGVVSLPCSTGVLFIILSTNEFWGGVINGSLPSRHSRIRIILKRKIYLQARNLDYGCQDKWKILANKTVPNSWNLLYASNATEWKLELRFMEG